MSRLPWLIPICQFFVVLFLLGLLTLSFVHSATYHDPSDEPGAEPIGVEFWSFDTFNSGKGLSKEELKVLIYQEVLRGAK